MNIISEEKFEVFVAEGYCPGNSANYISAAVTLRLTAGREKREEVTASCFLPTGNTGPVRACMDLGMPSVLFLLLIIKYSC